MNVYDQKRQARIERYKQRAAGAIHKAQQKFDQAQKMGDIIPLGQPILIGHHSEGRDRRYRGRIARKFEQAVQEQQKGNYWQRRAEAAEDNRAIRADDPTALDKLEAKLAHLEQQQQRMKLVNALCRKAKLTTETPDLMERLRELAVTEQEIQFLRSATLDAPPGEKIAFPSYRLTNHNATIRSVKQRIEQLKKAAAAITTEREIAGVRVVDNVEENRLQLFFPDKPSEDRRSQMKSHGFRWSSSSGCWQAFRSTQASFWAEQILCGE